MPTPVRPESFPRLALAALCLLAAPAMATPYTAALKARNYLDAERLANAALAGAPRDPQALAAKVDVIVATAAEARVDEAVALGEACVAANPRESACHDALGTALGSKAVGAGIFSAMGYAGKIRDAFRKAVELDPNNVGARFSLLQYYLVAPGSDLADQRRDALWSLGGTLMMEKRYADSERVFRELQAAYPDSELGLYGQARLRQEQGKHAEAVPLLEQAARIYPQGAVYYRLGQSLQAGGNKTRAVGAYEKALGAVPGLSKKLSADASAQVKTLKE